MELRLSLQVLFGHLCRCFVVLPLVIVFPPWKDPPKDPYLGGQNGNATSVLGGTRVVKKLYDWL